MTQVTRRRLIQSGATGVLGAVAAPSLALAQSKREGPAAHAVGSTKLKKATKRLSRFSVIVNLSDTFRYRAFVRLAGKGAIESGHSANVLIKAPKGTTKHKRS